MLNTIDDIVRIENAKIEMFEGKYMRLTVDKWGSMTRCVNITPEIRSLISFEDIDRNRETQKTESKIQPREIQICRFWNTFFDEKIKMTKDRVFIDKIVRQPFKEYVVIYKILVVFVCLYLLNLKAQK